MRHSGVREKLHLLFGGPHEEEAGCIEELEQTVSSNIEEDGRHVLTNGGKYWKLFGSPAPLLSLSTNTISTIRVAPAAINVYPKTLWTIVERGSD